ncbi:MAG: hypothetical protein ACYDDZ_03970 [Acidimicrobiales bacterium]
MFVAFPDRPAGEGPGRSSSRLEARASLALLAERTRPVSASQTQLLPVLPPLDSLFPDTGLRRGTTIVVSGTPTTRATGSNTPTGADVNVALALSAGASRGGSWCALVGVDNLGAVAAHEIGIDLGRLAIIPRPGAAWADVTGVLIGGIDLIVIRPPFPPRPGVARRLVARTRERRSVLVIVPGRSKWPEHPDLHLRVDHLCWEGAGCGTGHLSGCRMTVVATGRRSAVRPRRQVLWFPRPPAGDTGAAGAAGGAGAAGR